MTTGWHARHSGTPLLGEAQHVALVMWSTLVLSRLAWPLPEWDGTQRWSSSSLRACEFCMATREPNSTCDRSASRKAALVGQLGNVGGGAVELDEPLPLRLTDPQAPVHVNEVREAAHAAAEVIRTAEGLAVEGRQAIDVLWSARAEKRLQDRVAQNACVKGVDEAA